MNKVNWLTRDIWLTLCAFYFFCGYPPMDYTPGALVNSGREKNSAAIFERPMSLGTRAHQLAMYVVYEAPLQMLAGSPSHYLREPEVMEFLKAVPTVWDEVAQRRSPSNCLHTGSRYRRDSYMESILLSQPYSQHVRSTGYKPTWSNPRLFGDFQVFEQQDKSPSLIERGLLCC